MLQKNILLLLFFFIFQGTSALQSDDYKEKASVVEKKIDQLLEKADRVKYDDNELNLELIQQAEALALQNKIEKKLGEVYTAYGVSYYVNGSYDISLQKHIKALGIHEKYDNQIFIAKSLNGIGLVQMGLNQNHEAIKTFEKCAAMNQKIKNFVAVGRNHFNISIAEIELKNYKEALKMLRKTLKLTVESEDVDTEHMVYSRLGEVHLFLYEIDSSLYYYEKLFNHPKEPSKWEKAYSYAGVAKTYLAKSDWQQAEKYALASFEYSKEIDAKWDIERSTHILSDVYASKKDMTNAYKYLAMHKKYNDSLYDEEKIREINYLQLKRKEAENLQLNSEKEASLQKEKTNRIITYSFGLLVLFLLGILFLLMKNIKLKDKFNAELTQKNNDIEGQRAIIASQNEILEGLNKSKNHLFSILSHDLKSPINSIFQVLELQKQGHLTQDIQEEIFEQLLKQVEGTSMMLNNLLHWANTQMDGTVVNFENINLTDVVNTSIDSFYMEAFKKKITIHNPTENQSYSIYADLGQVRIIVQNVLANAIKFTPVEGRVEVFYTQDEQYQRLHIIDFGLGMSKNIVDEIVNYDKRMSSEMGTAMEKGTGLGLLLVKQFLINNKGKMHLKSEEGKGTEFVISFLKTK